MQTILRGACSPVRGAAQLERPLVAAKYRVHCHVVHTVDSGFHAYYGHAPQVLRDTSTPDQVSNPWQYEVRLAATYQCQPKLCEPRSTYVRTICGQERATGIGDGPYQAGWKRMRGCHGHVDASDGSTVLAIVRTRVAGVCTRLAIALGSATPSGSSTSRNAPCVCPVGSTCAISTTGPTGPHTKVWKLDGSHVHAG